MELMREGQYVAMAISAVLVVACVLLHYEILTLLTSVLKKINIHFRLRILALIFGLLSAHLAEIWIFAFGYYFMDAVMHYGHLQGINPQEGIWEYSYYSVVTYTTLGYGDIVPVGPVRFLAAMEALTGLMIVTWSASFTFLEMRIFWKDNK